MSTSLFFALASLLLLMMHPVINAKPDKSPRLQRRRRSRNAKSDDQTGLTLGDLDSLEVDGQNIRLGYSGFRSTEQIQEGSYFHDDSNSEESSKPQQKKSLRRINLDLSGRIMCHLFSPIPRKEERTVPLLCLPSETDVEKDSSQSLKRFMPRIYIGANYDLDEIWFGATRWIAKCSWGPFMSDLQTYTQMHNPIAKRAMKLAETLFPTRSFTSTSKWILDVEGERSVFDSTDTTVRISLAQPTPSLKRFPRELYCSPQKVTWEYDSAKYFEEYYSIENDSHTRSMQYSPIVKFNIQTPLLHPRLELHSKQTWIVKEGGDSRSNYYGGAYYGSESPAQRRLQQMKQLYHDNIPKSNPLLHQAQSSSGKSSIKAACEKLSAWLENDEWMPNTVTTDLMGNLVSLKNFGFGTLRKNTGLQIRMSKKIDWSKLGIFPWSNTNSYDSLKESSNGNQAAKVRIELCGMNESENKRIWVSVEAEPLNAMDTFKAVVGRECTYF